MQRCYVVIGGIEGNYVLYCGTSFDDAEASFNNSRYTAKMQTWENGIHISTKKLVLPPE